MTRNLAPVLLPDSRQQPLLSSIAHAADATMFTLTSSYNWLHHCQHRFPNRGRRHSLSDLHILLCGCPANPVLAHAELGGIIDSLHILDLGRTTEDNGDDYEDYPEDDHLYGGGDH